MWFQRFLRNVKIQLRSEDMTNSIIGGLGFYIENRGVSFGNFFTIFPMKSSILMLKAPQLSLRWRSWIESQKKSFR